ncbi:MAG TPA: hypothetical protein VGO67_04090 [Verrucomicrobiae bacterium]|jgi:hypothetical protein
MAEIQLQKPRFTPFSRDRGPILLGQKGAITWGDIIASSEFDILRAFTDTTCFFQEVG